MQSVLQILVVNEARKITPRTGGNPFTVQDAECVLCTDDGTPVKVGVLRLPEGLREVAKPGFFLGRFGLDVGWKDRQVEAVLVALQPVSKSATGFVAAGAPAVAKASS